MTEQQKIPKHWEIKKLGEVCKFIGGGTPSKQVDSFWNGNIPWASIKDIKGTHLLKTSDYITEEAITNSSTNVANPDELILATRINPGKVIVSKIRAAINQDLKIVRPKIEIDTSFLYYSFQNLERDIIKVSSGTTVLGIGLNHLNELDFILPPLAEQQAIVAKIEELLSDLENGKQQLLKAQQQLKVYRQSLLKWAFEGKLTTKNVKEGELPEGWKIVAVGDICKCIVPNRDKPKSFNGNTKWVTTPNLSNKSIRLNYNEIALGLSDFEIKEYNARVIPVGGVIMTCVGTFGLSAIVEKPIVINQQLHAFISNSEVDAKYLAYCIQYNKNYFERKSTSTTIQYLNKENCNSMPLPLPPLSEQQQIVEILESKLTVCDKLEETISQSLVQSETLRQSILKRAFEGRLV